MTIHVDVNQNRIDDGEHERCCSCPIANSIYEQGKREDVSIHPDDGHMTLITEKEESGRKSRERGIYRFKLPKVAQDFIKKWDAKEKVSPIEFDIEPTYWGKGTGRCTIPTLADVAI